MDSELLDLLKSFEVDPKFGFLLPDPQVQLPSKFQPWHDISENLPELLESKLLEDRINALPVVDTSELHQTRELRLAHLLLATLAAAYVWQHGRDEPKLSIPRQIAIPLLDVSAKIGLPPIVCHSSVCLANWKFVDGETVFRAENIELISFRLMNHIGNHWFFTLTAQLETEFAPAILAITRACKNHALFENTFTEIQRSLTDVSATIERMKERLPPEVFYHGFRLYLGGYSDGKIAKQGGMKFEGREDAGPQLWNGGSAGQSSTLHTVDGFLCIEHSGDERTFLKNQRDYMPPAHKRFVVWVEQNSALIPNLRDSPGYSETVDALRHFRDVHIQVVVLYLVLQMNPGAAGVGTGGTPFMKLLKAIRDDC